MSLDIFKKYATDESLETNGTWKAIGGGTKLLVARSGNRAYGKALSKAFEQHRAVLDADDDVADKKSDEIMIDVIANTILLGWESLVFKGKSLPYTVENAKTILALKDFRRDVVRIAEEMDNYLIVEENAQGEA